MMEVGKVLIHANEIIEAIIADREQLKPERLLQAVTTRRLETLLYFALEELDARNGAKCTKEYLKELVLQLADERERAKEYANLRKVGAGG